MSWTRDPLTAPEWACLVRARWMAHQSMVLDVAGRRTQSISRQGRRFRRPAGGANSSSVLGTLALILQSLAQAIDPTLSHD